MGIYSALAWLWSSFWSFLDCEMVFGLTFSHFFGEPVDFSLGRTENDGLGNGQGIVEIAKCVELPFFTFNSDKELFDTFQCQFITLDEDSDWIRHELVSHLQDFVWQSSRYQDNLSCWWKVSVNIVDLFFETTVQHFVGFVKNEKLYVSGSKISSSDHIECSTRGTNNDVLTKIQFSNIFTNIGTTNTNMGLDIHVIT